jgi:hypothetical protein
VGPAARRHRSQATGREGADRQPFPEARGRLS